MCDLLGHLWTMTLPYAQISFLCFLLLFCFLFLVTHPPPPQKKTLMWISKILICHLRLVKNLSYPRLPMCVVQSGSSSAVHADCALALINWVCSRRKRIVWAFEIFGRRLLCFLCLLTLVQPHTRFKKKKKKDERRVKTLVSWCCYRVLSTCVILKFWGFEFCYILFSSVFMLYMNRFRKGKLQRVLSLLLVGLGCTIGIQCRQSVSALF